jgi:hypothetical protein
MPAYFFSAINHPVDAPEGKLSSVPLAELRKISRFDEKHLRERAIAPRGLAVTARAVFVVLPFAAGDDFIFLGVTCRRQ